MLLLILLFICHYLADYTHLSTKWMLDAKRIGSPWTPILTHAFIHAALMAIPIAFLVHGFFVQVILFCLQLNTHFVIDVLKGKCNVWFPAVSDPKNKSHWYIFGFDQLLHQLVILTMWYLSTHLS